MIKYIYIEGPNEAANVAFSKEVQSALDGLDLEFIICEKITHDLAEDEFYCSLKAATGSTSDLNLRISFLRCLLTLLGISKAKPSKLKSLCMSYERKLVKLYNSK